MPRKATTTKTTTAAPARVSARTKTPTNKKQAPAVVVAEPPKNKRGGATTKKLAATPAPTTTTKGRKKAKTEPEAEEEEETVIAKKQPSARAKANAKKVEEANEDQPAVKKSARGKASTSKKKTDDSEEEDAPKTKATPPPATKKRAAPASKTKAKADDEEEQSAPAAKKVKAVTPPPSVPAGVIIPVDQYYPNRLNSSVVDDYDCMLNQTNIGANNNKFYKIQVIKDGARFVCFTRWGRVGEPGATQIHNGPTLDQAIKAFEKKFTDKTRNQWDERANFVKHNGKYQLVHIDHSQSAAQAAALAAARADANGSGKDDEEQVEVEPSSLDPELQQFIKLIFNKEMFNASMSNLKVDVTRLPLGALTKQQIKEGNEILEELMEELDGRARYHVLEQLSSRYYTLIPTAVGRSRPPTLNTKEMVQEKFDLLAVLGDIESAQDMQKKAKEKKKPSATKKVPNPIDQLYSSLEAAMHLVDPNSKEYKYISTYAKNTGGRKILNVFAVDRSAEQGKPFYDDLENRKLLWHGTNAAVVAAIIKSGLRIMPHSGGRVGRGIYLAAENSKSSGYVWPAPSGGKRIGMMFLAEAALGKEHHIVRDDSSLRAAPKGCHSIVAQGWTDPEPSEDLLVNIDGRKVKVPQGKPVSRPEYHHKSSFTQSEYLLYSESQHRLRYVLTFEW